MRAMRAEKFCGYEGLKLVDLPKTVVSDGKVLLRMTAVGVTPLEHTILSGHFPLAKAPLVLGGEGAGVVEAGGGNDFPVGSRVMFTGTYGVFEDGAYSEWLAVRKETLSSLCLDLARSNRSWPRPPRWQKRLMPCVTWWRVAPSAELSSQSDR